MENETVSFLDQPMSDMSVRQHLKVAALTAIVTTVVGAVVPTAVLFVQVKLKDRKVKKLTSETKS